MYFVIFHIDIKNNIFKPKKKFYMQNHKKFSMQNQKIANKTKQEKQREKQNILLRQMHIITFCCILKIDTDF